MYRFLILVLIAHAAIAIPHHKMQQRVSGAASAYAAAKRLPSDSLHARIAAYAKANRLTITRNKILVEIFLTDSSGAFERRLSRYGIRRDNYFGRVNDRVQALVPLRRLYALARDPHVRWIQPPTSPRPQRSHSIH